MADDKLNNNDQFFLDLIEKANEFLNSIPCANCNSRSGFNQEQQGEQSEQTHQPATGLEAASPKQPNQDAEQRSETNSNTNKIWELRNLFRNHRNDCTNNSPEETAGFLKVDEKVGNFIKERLNENIPPGWC